MIKKIQDKKEIKIKIAKALLRTKIADKLIDKYLSKRSILEMANTISK